MLLISHVWWCVISNLYIIKKIDAGSYVLENLKQVKLFTNQPFHVGQHVF